MISGKIIFKVLGNIGSERNYFSQMSFTDRHDDVNYSLPV